MPKEKIYDSSATFDIEVGWSREPTGAVQLGIATHSGVSFVDWLAGQEEHVLPDSRQLDDPDSHDRSLPSFSSLWATLDRAQINRLIKSLRKARDDAYGRDE